MLRKVEEQWVSCARWSFGLVLPCGTNGAWACELERELERCEKWSGDGAVGGRRHYRSPGEGMAKGAEPAEDAQGKARQFS